MIRLPHSFFHREVYHHDHTTACDDGNKYEEGVKICIYWIDFIAVSVEFQGIERSNGLERADEIAQQHDVMPRDPGLVA